MLVQHEDRYFGVYRAVVVDNNDPKNLGRIKVIIPQVSGENVTDWAWAINPPKATVTTITPAETVPVVTTSPAIDAGVFVMFEAGDPNFPLWIGTF